MNHSSMNINLSSHHNPGDNLAHTACASARKPSTGMHWGRLRRIGALGALASLCAADALAAGSSVATTIGSNFTELNTIIQATRIIVVTSAIIFSGYQMAFNNKRFGEVWPILLGGWVVGAAGGFANYFISGT